MMTRESHEAQYLAERENVLSQKAERYIRDIKERPEDWNGIADIQRLAQTKVADRDVFDKEIIAVGKFSGWTQEDFAVLLKRIVSDPEVNKIYREQFGLGELPSKLDPESREKVLNTKAEKYINELTRFFRLNKIELIEKLANIPDVDRDDKDKKFIAEEKLSGWTQDDFAELFKQIVRSDSAFRAYYDRGDDGYTNDEEI